MSLYPEISKQKIKLKWSKSKTSEMYKEGYRYCCECLYMIKINEYKCRRCKTNFRTRPRSASNLFNFVTESRLIPVTIRLRRKD